MTNGKKIALVAGTAILLLVAFVVGANLYKSQEDKQVRKLASADPEILVRDHSPKLGNPDAKVTVVEYLDPECEACRAAHPYVKDLLKKYPEKVQLVVRYAAFHANAGHAIRVLEAARQQGKFSAALDVMFQNQPEWADHHNPQPKRVFDFLPQAFIDVERIKRDMEDPAIAQVIAQDQADLEALNVRGTPTFFVNGKRAGIRELFPLVEQEIKRVY